MVGILALILFFDFGYTSMQRNIYLILANALQASYIVIDYMRSGSDRSQEFIPWSHSYENVSADISPRDGYSPCGGTQ